ncbi:hypothetical protein ACH4E8_34355 [Streptomyces sp. NPDC017979]|uniref:hypothetical protein n=1 Tax=Streptomyces sp. NPDC017979 TaxID=3365024 RepID=UPI0037AEBE50
MSADSYLVVRCDAPGCDAEGHWPVRHIPYTHTELRRLLRIERGWSRPRSNGRLEDRCPNHPA